MCKLKPFLTMLSALAPLAFTQYPENASAASAAQPFSVRDSIEMMRLIDPNPTLVTLKHPDFKLSPDGRKLAFVVRHGNLETGKNEYELRTFLTSDIRRFSSSGA